eukprot:497292_1
MNHLIPIVVNDMYNCNSIEWILIINIIESHCNIGISFQYDETLDIYIATAIYLDKTEIELKHKLIDLNCDYCTCNLTAFSLNDLLIVSNNNSMIRKNVDIVVDNYNIKNKSLHNEIPNDTSCDSDCSDNDCSDNDVVKRKKKKPRIVWSDYLKERKNADGKTVWYQYAGDDIRPNEFWELKGSATTRLRSRMDAAEKGKKPKVLNNLDQFITDAPNGYYYCNVDKCDKKKNKYPYKKKSTWRNHYYRKHKCLRKNKNH